MNGVCTAFKQVKRSMHACALYQRKGSTAMESMRRHKEEPAPCIITLPQRSLLVLCGPAGCGKSTFARWVLEQQDPPMQATVIVSSDTCRAIVCDDESNQQVNRDTFD